MKSKIIILFTVLTLIFFTVGCSNDDANVEDDDNQIGNVNVGDNHIGEIETETQVRKPIENINKAEGDADVDLTILSSTMVFGEVFNMVTNPEEYLGKSIKIRGEYYSYYDSETDNTYFFVIIADALGCCQQGLEFTLNDDHTFPEDYPEDGKEVEFIGVFDKYEELGNTYYYLLVDEIIIL